MKKLLATTAVLSALSIFTGSAIASPFDSQCWDPDEVLISRPNGASALCVDDEGTLDETDDEYSLYRYRGSEVPYLTLAIKQLNNGMARIAIHEAEMENTPPYRVESRRLSISFDGNGVSSLLGDEALMTERKAEIIEFVQILESKLGAIAR